MQTWIALLRGINVGGATVVPMKELISLFEKCNLHDIKTYIQSGNVVFRTEEGVTSLSKHIKNVLDQNLAFHPKLLLRTVEQLQEAAEANPFPQGEADPKSLHLYFLSEPPKNRDLDGLTQLKKKSESFAIIGSTFYLHAPDGIGRSKLAAQVERHVGVDATARNWRTVCKVLEMAQQTS